MLAEQGKNAISDRLFVLMGVEVLPNGGLIPNQFSSEIKQRGTELRA
jgi:hypothetical protein